MGEQRRDKWTDGHVDTWTDRQMDRQKYGKMEKRRDDTNCQTFRQINI
jgi:hypothetical protein